MKLQTQTFKDFFYYTKSMKPNNLLTIYGYMLLTIKNGIGTLEKTNGTSYCKYTFASDGDICVLLEDVEIKTFIDNIKGQEFDLTVDDNITLSANAMTLSFTTISVDEYPKHQLPSSETVKVNTSPYFIASKYIEPSTIGWMQYVVSDENGVLGTDNFRIYFSSGNYPKIVLGVEACNAISGLTDVHYISTENHDFFISDNVIYGFNKPMFEVPKYMSVVNKIENGGFKVKRADVLLFCDTTTPRSDKACSMSGNGENSMVLNLHDTDKNKKNTLTVEIDGECDTFIFNPKKMAALLRPLPYETLNFKIGSNLSITTDEDENYKGTLTQLINK